MDYVNRNICKTFKYTFASNNTESLSSFSQECSEVSIRPRVSAVSIFDSMNPTVGYELLPNEEFTFRGLTNLSSISAKGTTGNVMYLRTQYFSNTIL